MRKEVEMRVKVGLGATVRCDIYKRKPIIKSVWDVVCTGEDGKQKWSEQRENVVTDQGLQYLLDVAFLHGTQIVDDDWYVALIEDGDSPTDASTYAVPVYTETVAYDVPAGPKRVGYVGVRSDLTITNTASKAAFTISATKDLLGAALVGGAAADADTPGDVASTGAKLYCAVEFSELKPVVDNDIVTIMITLQAAGW
jgi:hypothetical protein